MWNHACCVFFRRVWMVNRLIKVINWRHFVMACIRQGPLISLVFIKLFKHFECCKCGWYEVRATNTSPFSLVLIKSTANLQTETNLRCINEWVNALWFDWTLDCGFWDIIYVLIAQYTWSSRNRSLFWFEYDVHLCADRMCFQLLWI